ncbi:MAG TPA: hypothetical protein VIY52_19230 [Streptosporangiaceae bacterium]
MDEITMFSALRPDPPAPTAAEAMLEATRERLATAPGRAPRGRARQRRRIRVAVGALAAAASATAALALAWAAGGSGPGLESISTAAWTVRQNAGGTVTIEIRQLTNPAGLQRALRSEGVQALILGFPAGSVSSPDGSFYYLNCRYTNAEPQAVQQMVVAQGRSLDSWTIDPAAMPAGSTLFIAVWLAEPNVPGGRIPAVITRPMVLENDHAPACVLTVPPQLPLPPRQGGSAGFSPRGRGPAR